MENKEARELLSKTVPGTQCHDIMRWLVFHGSITAIEALTELGVMRLAARVSDLRELGIEITTLTVKKNGKHYAKYVLGRSV